MKPGTIRYYPPGPFSLSGQQMKLSVKETWGCDECWEQFKNEEVAQLRARLPPLPEMRLTVVRDPREDKQDTWKRQPGWRRG